MTDSAISIPTEKCIIDPKVQAHDALFRQLMGHPEDGIAMQFLQQHLPAELCHHLRRENITVLPQTYIEKTLQRSEVDSIYMFFLACSRVTTTT